IVDILKKNNVSTKFDVIVSNPPYVDVNEKSMIDSKVKDFEPHSAIFVESDDNMIFYKNIITKSKTLLKKNGFLYFESHSSRINILENMLKINNFKRIIIKEDLFGNKRMISAQK
ncbi:MAG: protein-(glutamine-N5) methyltransferase, release factor-specific, partial [Flavobacteriales bacterium]|nr:protein-(glutamine-N5) methyltransferase, release factor-specific [Flavobacteriales bacterium]